MDKNNQLLDRLTRVKNLLINKFMKDGKKNKAAKIVNNIFNDDQSLLDCMEKLQVTLYTKKRTIAGSTKHIPVEINQRLRDSLATKWFVDGTRKYIKNGLNAIKAGKNLLEETLKEQGAAIQFKQASNQLVKDNRALKGFRW